MFDFTNYTYSGMLSIVAAIFGIAYPQINASIERIDDKYGGKFSIEVQKFEGFQAL